jgi:hypothetical protein
MCVLISNDDLEFETQSCRETTTDAGSERFLFKPLKSAQYDVAIGTVDVDGKRYIERTSRIVSN